jgi:tetratricopeptide (TPR) repeat protein
VADLEKGESHAVMQIDMAEIQEEDGRNLLAVEKLKGTRKELQAVSRTYGNHPLALRLLSGFIKEFHNRDAAAAYELEPSASGGGISPPVARVLINFERHASPQLIRFLGYVGLFARPCTLAELQAAGLDANTLSDLRDTGRRLYLVDEEDERAPGYVDVHPLLREYFGQQLRQSSIEEWKDANNRMAGFFFKNSPFQPDSLSEMLPLFEAVAHGCRAGVPVRAFNQYYKRIERERAEYQIYTLGAHGLTLSTLSEFFEKPWTQFPENLPDTLRATLLNRIGRCLKALGRGREAIGPLTEALQYELKIPDNQENAGIAAEDLASLHLEHGNPREALRYAQQALSSYESAVIGAKGDFAKIKRVLVLRSGSMSTVAVSHWNMAEADRAKDAFDRMIALHDLAYMQLALPPRPVTSTAGYRYGQFLVESGSWTDALKQADAVINYAGSFADDRIKGHLLAAEAWLQGGQPEKARPYADQAQNAAVAFGDRPLLARTLLVRAECRSAGLQHELARMDLDSAATIARRGGLKLLEVETLLASTKAWMKAGEIARARNDLGRATTALAERGYTRATAIANTMRLELSAF